MSEEMDGLIGHTGFVGSNLMEQRSFGKVYRSTDIDLIEGQAFRHLFCAGVTATKWWANQNEDEDRRRIESLIAKLDRVEAETFILISTVDVYGDPSGVSEATDPAPVQPYGVNRFMLEQYVERRFPSHIIVRLPALFGYHLKKNAIYDLLNSNRLDHIPADGRFQWYPLSRLSSDLEMVVRSKVPKLNFATENVAMREIANRYFADVPIGNASTGASPTYDMQTEFGHLFGKNGRYIMTSDEVLENLGGFVSEMPG